MRISPPSKLFATGLFVCLVVPLSAGAAPKQPLAPLTTAKTIQVQEITYFSDRSGAFYPEETLTVKIARPNRIWIQQVKSRRPEGDQAKPSVYVSNAGTEWEYDGSRSVYLKGAAPKHGEGSRLYLVSLYNRADINLVMGRRSKPNPTGYTRTITREVLDGKPMNVSTLTFRPWKLSNGQTMINSVKYWTDSRTGLPCRYSHYITQDGKTLAIIRTDFSHWVLNQPIPATQFAWRPPATAKLYVEPTPPPAPPLLAVGTPAPDFTLPTADGSKTVSLADLKGQVVVLDFWASWCPPCKAALPHTQALSDEFKDKGVTVLAVNTADTKAGRETFLKAHPEYTMTVLFDADKKQPVALGAYHVTGIPTFYVIDQEGKVAATYVGYDPNNDKQITAVLAKLGVNAAAPNK